MRATPVGILLLAAACGGGGEQGGGTGGIGTGGSGAAGGGSTGGAGTGGAAGFLAIAPCGRAEDYVTATAVVTVGDSYEPRCARVVAGQALEIEASDEHPLAPRTGGSAASPIPDRVSTSTVAFPTAGFYPFQCTSHATAGMVGVVWVIAP